MKIVPSMIYTKKHVLIFLKGALDKYNIIPPFFSKYSWDFSTVRSVGMGNDCMLSVTF